MKRHPRDLSTETSMARRPIPELGPQLDNEDKLFEEYLDGKVVLPDPVRRSTRDPQAARPKPPDPDELLFLQAVAGHDPAAAARREAEVSEPAGPEPRLTLRALVRRRGEKLEPDSTIDLHGRTVEAAKGLLAAHLRRSAAQNRSLLCIVVGRGLHSPGEPVLKGAVQGWLGGEFAHYVGEHMPAPSHLGGSGAFLVMLRSKVGSG
jgi:DNA-nicking Smr family endonuclease